MAEIGSILRETRMRARIDISEVEAHTKIRAKYLRAIENEDWDLLPGPVFVKSFLKTYGDYLGIDVNIAARVAEAAKADQVLVSEAALSRIDSDGVVVGRRKRLKAQGAPRDLRVVEVSR